MLEFWATLFRLPIIKVVRRHRSNPKLFCNITAISVRVNMNMHIPNMQTEIRYVREYLSANFGTSNPHMKLPKNSGIGKRKETSPNSSLGYFSIKKSIAVRIAFHPIREAIPSNANVSLCLNYTYST